MGSLSKRLARAMAYRGKGKEAADHAEGMILSRRLERAARENGATDPLHFLDYLKQMRRGYDPRTDGPSKLMQLVDDITQFEREELARRKLAAGQTVAMADLGHLPNQYELHAGDVCSCGHPAERHESHEKALVACSICACSRFSKAGAS